MSYYFIFLPTILLALLTHSSEVIVNIVPSVDPSCSTSCLTLSDFASHLRSENDITDDTILILGPGNHTLTLAMLVNLTNINSFSMLSKIQNTFVICSHQASFKFKNMRMVEL